MANGSGSRFISRRLQVERRGVMVGQDLGNGMQMALAAVRAQGGITGWVGEQHRAVGYGGRFRVGLPEERAAL